MGMLSTTAQAINFDLVGSNLAEGVGQDTLLFNRFNRFTRAIMYRHGVCIHYREANGGESARVVFPVALQMSARGSISVRAWCTMRNEWRTFCLKADRMLHDYVVEGLSRPAGLEDGITVPEAYDKGGIESAM